MQLIKYPRTQHLYGSRLQPGDDDLTAVPMRELRGTYIVVEEKVDGANAGVSFDESGQLFLQSRGHFLTGGGRERHFALFKTWANTHARALWERLSSRYLMFGEWVYAKHTIFYDALPHYFLEFDCFDRETQTFLSTERRRELLEGAPVQSVLVLYEGPFRNASHLVELVGPSRFKTAGWRDVLRDAAEAQGLDRKRVAEETDPSEEMEGLYIKVEEDGEVRQRLKYVRTSFLTSVVDSGSHWLTRPIVPNRLRDGVDIF